MRHLLIFLLLCPSLCWAEASRNFDGTDDVVSNSSVANSDEATRSVSFWFKTSTLAGTTVAVIVTDGSDLTAGNSAFNVAILNEFDALRIGYRWSTTAGNWKTPNSSIAIDTWYHVFASYDRGSTTNDPVCYLNGVLQTLTETATPVGTAKTGVAVFRAGANVALAEDYTGLVAFIDYFNTIVPTGFITQLMYVPHSISDGLVLAWAFWGDSPEPDFSGGGETGTVSGATTSTDGPPIMVGGYMPL